MAMLIVDEGLDYSGKSSFGDAFVAKLNASGYPAVASFEPGGTPFGNALRTMVKNPRRLYDQDITELTRVVIFNAARMEHLDKVILPALAQDKIVVLDRFWWSTLVYAPLCLDNQVLDLHKRLCDNIKADFTFLHDIDYSTFIERRGFRGVSDEIEDNLYEHFDLMRNRYLDLADKDSNSMVLSQSLSIDEKVTVAYSRLRRRLSDDRRRTVARKADNVRSEFACP